MLRIFGWSFAITAVSIVVAFVYGSWEAVALVVILGILEVSLSFDNAVINATVLRRMSDFWQKIFLTIGIVIAVFGMRLVFPLVIVWAASGLGPVDALRLALNPPADDAAYFPDGSPSYETLITDAHPQIAAFGGMFLMMLFLGFIFEEREHTWLSWIEKPLAKAGKLDMLPVVVAGVSLVLAAEFLAEDEKISTVMVSGVLGMVTYITVNGLGNLFHVPGEDEEESSGPSDLAKATGKAGFFLFLYLEVLDASFSFDGVIGAFAITADPIIIALGLGFIGAMFVRSLTVFLVRKGTLDDYVYLEHGAHWAIGALAAILLVSIGVHINEIVTGLVGVVLIGLSFFSSVRRNRRLAAEGHAEDAKVDVAG
ncbi:DUF475 domain-containing protein [Rhodococcus kroppenstedtii]|uniref:DUF475 domain-containing protein n=1 Tax=Rhodococcoides kroppenstedtii TaxID=293050 RepID=A0A1I0TGQ0_9NOCA|nr:MULTISPECIES: DUF475 domain-containing protein [Rhodococcus]AMY21179.1 hypothetical protein A3Q40_03831 [Rhodococcus sp. PBTS 1]MBT1190522.1 DUF475 domain-containing protein [Rhodococcus kroppenstedtii]MBY6314588.1 DUF475 domain-containing protein [Rhodococcus kroppenstedtii]MBY6322395.1 DUF475 domain-containing protein [Rhodococcus kroppenstedtii]MBY6401199.1 DUF475 domain-containing protein [Rhodococcus kroppenstedtii]